MNLLGAQTFCIHKMTEIIMVYKEKNFMFTVFQVMTPSFKDFNNG